MNALELATTEEKLQSAESRLRERDVRVAILERENERLDKQAQARLNERLPLVEYVGYRAMINCLEYAKSPLRRREGPKAPRVAVWEEIFADDRFFLESVLKKVDFGTCARAWEWVCLDLWGGSALSAVPAGNEHIHHHHHHHNHHHFPFESRQGGRGADGQGDDPTGR